MIISIQRWRVLVVWCGLLGMAFGGHDGKMDRRKIGQDSYRDKRSSSLSPQINTSRGAGDEVEGASWYYPTTWPSFEEKRTVSLNQSYTPRFEVGLQGPQDAKSLALCYTTNFQAPESANIYYVIPLTFTCLKNDPSCQIEVQKTGTANLEVNLYNTSAGLSTFTKPNSAFFLCFNNGNDTVAGFTCESYSPYFQILRSPSLVNQRREETADLVAAESSSMSAFASSFVAAITNYAAPTAPLSVTASTAIFLPSGGTVISASTTAPNIPISTSYASTVTTPILTPTGTDGSASATGTSDSSNSSSTSSNSSGLSLGAKIGIALGAIIFVFLLLLALLLLLRRRRKNLPKNASRTPENLLLSSSLKHNNDSNSLFIAEKLALTDRSDTNTPLTSRGAGILGGTFDHDDDLHQDLPAPGSAFTANTPVPISPRRSQAANTLRSEAIGSRAVSIASGISRPVSPVNSSAGNNIVDLSRENSRERIGDRSIFDQEPYTDNVGAGANSGAVGMNGDRNGSRTNLDVPKVYKGALQAPFLSEPGMSAEEVARLEEEERRIDEAIAEAEEERRRAREARGR
ncbi:uncharacterized protein EAE98_005471 [Botrytis deweyae]|uniref:Mid2 domain-containing protein n=1 Tax=Botrytis deweyae TaxID=2478750 RepID=A0ABQ7ILV3_9HELO|nr:uncharacterized protein EAE98_005471 [Botrytis deweyae]KAF7928415.1 hypothetical protein EAE98_005471 [Botrytis deweyae]